MIPICKVCDSSQKKTNCNKASIWINLKSVHSYSENKKIKSLESIKTEKIDSRTDFIRGSIVELRPNH